MSRILGRHIDLIQQSTPWDKGVASVRSSTTSQYDPRQQQPWLYARAGLTDWIDRPGIGLGALGAAGNELATLAKQLTPQEQVTAAQGFASNAKPMAARAGPLFGGVILVVAGTVESAPEMFVSAMTTLDEAELPEEIVSMIANVITQSAAAVGIEKTRVDTSRQLSRTLAVTLPGFRPTPRVDLTRPGLPAPGTGLEPGIDSGIDIGGRKISIPVILGVAAAAAAIIYVARRKK